MEINKDVEKMYDVIISGLTNEKEFNKQKIHYQGLINSVEVVLYTKNDNTYLQYDILNKKYSFYETFITVLKIEDFSYSLNKNNKNFYYVAHEGVGNIYYLNFHKDIKKKLIDLYNFLNKKNILENKLIIKNEEVKRKLKI